MSEAASGFHLRSCVWELTLACCFSCKYCGSAGGAARRNELSTAECLFVADQLAELGCEFVTLIGGEVFLRPDWDAVAARLRERGIRAGVITNGFLFTDELIERIRQSGLCAMAVSLDGPEAVHDKYRQDGSFARATLALQRLTERGVPTSVVTTLNRENAAYLEEFYAFLKQFPIYAWQLQGCSPMGNAAANGVDYRFDPRRVLKFVRENAPNAPFSIGVADNIGYFTEGEGMLRGNLSGVAVFAGCRAGLSAIGIDSEGNVRGCESMYDDRFIEGNLRQRSLRDIWEDPDAFPYNRRFTTDMLTGKCSGCKYGVLCGGGCRSYNYFVHGKFYEAPFCACENT